MAEMKQDMYGAIGKIGGSFGHHNLCSRAKAAGYSYKTPEINMESELYLNNADKD
ncbi:MAG: hypothetical protein J6W52_06050 [Bacteroidaceae bacterium]|nr:hypothetical protein [Bacteroidaceae bacterium]